MKRPVYFISHGGGPWPWMRAETGGAYDQLARALEAMPRDLGTPPRALLVVTAHWEAAAFTVQGNAKPPMIYDYGGFPDYTYRIQYPAPGDPALAQRVAALISAAGLPAQIDPQRGLDHGTFSAMAVAYPKADMPIVQLSLKAGLDPAEHIALGRALAPLRDEDVVIIGSGLSYHNLRAFNGHGAQPSQQFDAWLNTTMTASTPAQRTQRLLDWEAAPSARLAHPREEHLIPLMVAVGAAEHDPAQRVYHEARFMGALAVSNFRLTAVA